MLLLILLSFFKSYGAILIFGISLIAILILFIYRLKTQEKKDFEMSNVTQKGIDIHLKMQAYERLTIFLERTDPVSLLNTIDRSGKNIESIELDILKVIVSEFQYNISQQVYVSDTLWTMIVASKNKTINLVNSVKNSLKKNATGADFFNAFKLVLENQETTPSRIALSYLKKEVRSI